MDCAILKTLDCSFCGEHLTKEEAENPAPGEEKEVICDDCWRASFEDLCGSCGEFYDERESNHSIFVLFESVRALGVDKLKPGYYKVLRFPIYADGMIEGFVFAGNVERIADLNGDEGESDDTYPAHFLCPECMKKFHNKGKEMNDGLISNN